MAIKVVKQFSGNNSLLGTIHKLRRQKGRTDRSSKVVKKTTFDDIDRGTILQKTTSSKKSQKLIKFQQNWEEGSFLNAMMSIFLDQ